MTDWSQYVGLPFGDERHEFTCWGLVRLVLKNECGLDLPQYGEISYRDLASVARAVEAGQGDEVWREIDQPRAFDVVLMRIQGSKRVGHVGVMTGDDKVLHVEAATNSVILPTSHWSVRGRISGYRRHACL